MQKNDYDQTTRYGDVYLQLFNTSIEHADSESKKALVRVM